jgi:hypothetical protein
MDPATQGLSRQRMKLGAKTWSITYAMYDRTQEETFQLGPGLTFKLSKGMTTTRARLRAFELTKNS